MKKLLVSFVAAFMAWNAHAAIAPMYQDIKLPTQKVIERQTWAAPVAAATSVLLIAVSSAASSVAQTITTFSAQPDFPRNLVLLPGGTASGVGTCTATVNGTNYYNKAISENFSLTFNTQTLLTGSKAFKTVTSVVFPAACVSTPYGAKWSLGLGAKLGLKNCMTGDVDYLQGSADETYESTRATTAANASAVESNTLQFNTAPNASRNFKAFFMQNFQCVN